MPHHITHSSFGRTSLTTCDVFVMALSYLDARSMPSPEGLVESVAPWYLDAESVWWRVFVLGLR
ncbi:hypothetical protein DM02DRAFT_529780 [Periconia macrospinosa]|uniref:Uncharacterized protein n=1 Tax=Periconia macrospinosa TaxID=97972 RepID=A0A2V1DMH3_9PLEO|nr:hypothetical protein DM02DRAFT_529780 [Periconia macrospinosa]